MVHGKPRLAGTGQRGNSTKESSPLEAPLAQLNEPSGVAADEGELPTVAVSRKRCKSTIKYYVIFFSTMMNLMNLMSFELLAHFGTYAELAVSLCPFVVLQP